MAYLLFNTTDEVWRVYPYTGIDALVPCDCVLGKNGWSIRRDTCYVQNQSGERIILQHEIDERLEVEVKEDKENRISGYSRENVPLEILTEVGQEHVDIYIGIMERGQGDNIKP